MIWTGSKVIVWGGDYTNDSGVYFTNTGGMYDPVSDTWTPTNVVGAPSARCCHSAVWTGSKMIIWGGYDSNHVRTNTGAIYDPATGSWTKIATLNAPTARENQSAIWTGSKMIIWGGLSIPSDFVYFNTGGIYDPVSDSWTATSTSNAPSPRYYHSAIWTGSKMLIWGGMNLDQNDYYATGGLYDPVTDSWQATSMVNVPFGRGPHSTVWTGNKMIVWGGFNGYFMNSGGLYDPAGDYWVQTTMDNVPLLRSTHTAVWTGNKMIIWGGAGPNSNILNSGGVYSNDSLIGIHSVSSQIPKSYVLEQNFPNPFNPTTKIDFQITEVGMASLKIYDVLGRVVAILVNEQLKPGSYEVSFDGSNVASGMYFYKLQAGSFVETKKMVLLK